MPHTLLTRATILLLSSSLGACGFMTPAQQYAGEARPASEISVSQGYQGSLFGDEYHATISAFSAASGSGTGTGTGMGAPGVQRFGLPGFTDYPREIAVNPGRYVIELYCFKSLGQPGIRPTLDLAVKAGVAYTVKCEPSNGQAAVFVSQETRLL